MLFFIFIKLPTVFFSIINNKNWLASNASVEIIATDPLVPQTSVLRHYHQP